MDNKIVPIDPHEVHEYPWGSAVYSIRKKRYTNLYLFPDAQEIEVEHLNILLHENGIEFI